MNITSTITSNPDRPMIPSEASGKRKASDDNSLNTNGALKPKRPRNDNSASNKRKLLNGEEQRSGLVIIRGSQSQPPSSQPSSNGSSALAGPSQPPNKRLRETPTNAPITKGKYKSPDEEDVVEEDVRRMEMETDALRRAAHHSRDPLPSSDTLLPLAPRETPKIEQNRAMRGEGSRTPRRASMSSRGKRLSNSFDRTGVITQPHPSVNDTSLYKHIDSELPDPDRARQLILLCAARAPLPAPREGKDPPGQLSEKGVKLFQDMKDDLLLLLAERKIDLKGMRNDEPGSATNRGVEVRANEQNVNNRGRTARFKDAIHLAKAEDDAWTAVGQFYNAYQESVMKELEQRQKAKGKQRADPEEDLRISELPERFHNAVNLARSVLAKDATGGHDPHSHRWNELRYQTDELHTLVHTTVQMANAAETDIDRRFAHLSHILHARTRPAAGPPTQPAPTLSTFLPRRHADPSDSRDVLRALARVEAARPANQVSVAASRAAREVQRAQDAPASERRMTLVAPPTPRTPRRPGTPGRGR
ncbi:Mis12-Mtw1 protein family-domain-containing protein [Lactarius vividus]|nr:Mis12-Mtw1 protein family-domain-containing protein [Lactarius vividus]